MYGGHLKESKRWILNITDKERIAIILKHLWVDYPQADNIILAIRNMIGATGLVQSPCLLISGASGSGKTSIVRHIQDVSRDWNLRIAYMSCADKFDKLKFKESIVSALGAPNLQASSSRRDGVGGLEKLVKLNGTRALIIDEFHDAMLVQKQDQQKNLSFLKGLSGDPFNLTIIALGTPLAVNALSIDPQLFRRFDFVELMGWEENEVFRSFLASIEENLPLKNPSRLYEKEIVRHLLSESKGNMASIIDILRFGAVQAITSGEERITVDLLKAGGSQRWMYKVRGV